MFEKLLFKIRNPNRTEEQPSETLICQYESSTHECKLIQILKEKQNELNSIKAEIKSFKESDPINISTFITFLKRMEYVGFEMRNGYRYPANPNYCVSKIENTFSTMMGMNRLEHVLNQTTIEEIDKISKELITLKQKQIILSKKESIEEALIKDIADIKSELGIK